MTTSEDVKTLFRRFGGQPETYQEVVREDLAEHSLGKWPMLGQVNLQKIDVIPAAKQKITTVATRPYSESLAVAQAGQQAVAEYVASHRFAEASREAPPPAAFAPSRQELRRPPYAEAIRPADPAPQVSAVAAQAAPPVIHRQAASVQTSSPPVASRISPFAPTVAQVQPEVQAAQITHVASPVSRAEPVSSLAARFRRQSVATAAPEPAVVEPIPQSLHGLFGRLAQSQVRAETASGLLKRKLIK